MKFRKTLASVCAAAIAVSSLAVSAFAGDDGYEKADISFTDGKTPSYTYTVKGDIDALKVDVALSADAAAAGSGWNDYCSAGVAVKNPDGTVKYYQWGGASIAWAWDVNGDGVGETKDGVGTETWVGTVGADGGQLSIPVVKGAVVDFYCLSWDAYKGVQYTLTINDEEAAVKPGEPDPVDPAKPIQTKADISFTDGKTPSYTYTVKGDIDALKVDVALSADAAAAGSGWNDYCSAGVAVKNPDGTVKYYQWGGASIAWAWDVNGDGVGDTKDGVGTETWVGTVGADGGQLSIPVVKGAVVDFYCLSWDSYKGVQYTLTINDEEAAVKPSEPDPVEPVDPAKPAAPADVTIANSGKTVIDSGIVRTNIINEWTGDAADVIADKADFAGANKISVKFTVTNFTTPFKAWIGMADSKWECQFQDEGNAVNANAKCTPVEVTGNGTYVVTIDLDKVIDGVAYIAVRTDLKAAEGDAIPTIAIDQVRINEEITVKPGETEDPTKPGETEDPTKPGETEDPTKPGETEDPAEPGESSGDVVNPGECSGEPVNPPTGAAVAVVPAVLAAAAVATTGIVLKKRSK